MGSTPIFPTNYTAKNGEVAQLVRAIDFCTGSIPVKATILGFVAQLVEHYTHNVGYGLLSIFSPRRSLVKIDHQVCRTLNGKNKVNLNWQRQLVVGAV
mgnify:CR=1 FL=1